MLSVGFYLGEGTWYLHIHIYVLGFIGKIQAISTGNQTQNLHAVKDSAYFTRSVKYAVCDIKKGNNNGPGLHV